MMTVEQIKQTFTGDEQMFARMFHLMHVLHPENPDVRNEGILNLHVQFSYTYDRTKHIREAVLNG